MIPLFPNQNMEAVRGSGVNIAAIGGGTGLASMLRGLKLWTENLTAIVTTADDGGGSGILRNDFGMIPPGDIRNCILALANTEPIMSKLLNYRFPEGSMAGQSFGNLFLAALTGISRNFDEAIERMSDVLAVTGRVVPVSMEPTVLEAIFEDGTRVVGESRIAHCKKEQRCRIQAVSLLPSDPLVHQKALEAVENADLIVLGPGSLYTSVIPNLLVTELAEALRAAGALRVYVCNIMTQVGETEGYTCFDHAEALTKHGGGPVVDVCLCNNEIISPDILASYAAENAEAARIDRHLFAKAGLELRERPLMHVKNGHVRHDPLRLAFALAELFCEKRSRAGLYGQMDEMVLSYFKAIIDNGQYTIVN